MSKNPKNGVRPSVPESCLASLLIVDSDREQRRSLREGLRRHFGLIETAEDAESAKFLLERCYFNLIIAEIDFSSGLGAGWLNGMGHLRGDAGLIFTSPGADVETAVSALRVGADDLIAKPFRMEEMLAAVERCLDGSGRRKRVPNQPAQVASQSPCDDFGFVGECDMIKNVCDVIQRVAPMPSTILIEGESGTGKELAAKAIHHGSARSGSFVAVNCGAISPELIESELFGHVKGAFTGAHQDREGLFSYASGGTLFLDEVGEMPLAMQAHLLRSIDQRTIRPVGSNRDMDVDVRIIGATNRDLGEEVRKGNFREDLFYRLNVLTLRMPALKERPEDLPLLARHFVSMLSEQLGIAPLELGEEELTRLLRYNWPGNVRELKNVIERALLLKRPPSEFVAAGDETRSEGADDPDSMLLEDVERRHIQRILNRVSGNKSAAARILGVSRKTLERRVQLWKSAGSR